MPLHAMRASMALVSTLQTGHRHAASFEQWHFANALHVCR